MNNVTVNADNLVFASRSRIILMRKRDDIFELYSTVGRCVVATSPDAEQLREWAHSKGMAVNDNLARGNLSDRKWIERDADQPTFKKVDLGGNYLRST